MAHYPLIPDASGYFVFPAHGKLNLFLHVVGRRPDGYHLLQSVFQLVALADLVGIRPRKDGVIERIAPIPGVPAEADLVTRAARLLQKHTGTTWGADLRLEKHLPIGGGMGGGSSDAATVLLALNRLWNLNLSRPELMSLGLTLGADVPFFLLGQNAFVEGIGEILTPITTPPSWFVVLHPQVHVPTPEIFKAPDLQRNTPLLPQQQFTWKNTHNDLEPVACRLYPAIARCRDWLAQYGLARMTGSGSCVFASFASQEESDLVVCRLPESTTGFVTQAIDQHSLCEFALD